MAKKTYRTYRLKSLNILLKEEDGKRREIVFRGGVQVDSTAKFSTTDEKLQERLESMSGFKRDYYLESVEEKGVPGTEPVVNEDAPTPEPDGKAEDLGDVKGQKVFHNLPEMRNAMIEAGIEIPEGTSNYLALRAIAKKAGYDYQIQKNK